MNGECCKHLAVSLDTTLLYPPYCSTTCPFDVGVVVSFGHMIPTSLIKWFPRYLCFACLTCVWTLTTECHTTALDTLVIDQIIVFLIACCAILSGDASAFTLLYFRNGEVHLPFSTPFFQDKQGQESHCWNCLTTSEWCLVGSTV